jgi:anti-sigma B factor antagonist
MPEEVVDDGFKISTRRADPDIVLIDIVGDLDMQTVSQATAFLAEVTAIAPRHLILDLSRVTFLASSGMGLLIAAQSGGEGIGGRLHLLGVIGNPPVERPLGVVGLLDRFDIALDLEALLAKLDSPRPHRIGF